MTTMNIGTTKMEDHQFETSFHKKTDVDMVTLKFISERGWPSRRRGQDVMN